MTLVSVTSVMRSLSRNTGNLPMGQSAMNSAYVVWLMVNGTNGVLFGRAQ